MSEWINVDSGERPGDDESVLARNDKFPNHLPEFVCWYEEEQEFLPLHHHSTLPVKVTHWMPLPKPPKDKDE